MGTRTVRLNESDEEMLARVRSKSGESVSAVIKRALRALFQKEAAAEACDAWDIYRQLDLGEGGSSLGPAAESRRVAREAILKRHER